MFKPVLLFLAFLFPCGAEEFPDINELFAVTSLPGVARRRANVERPKISPLSINLEKLDINRFKKKLKELEDRIESPTFESRKQFIKYLPKEGFIDYEYDKAYKYKTKLKFMDLMLQLVYQARHKMKILSMNSVFKIDKPFKLSYLHAKMRANVNKLRRIYTTQYERGFVYIGEQRWRGPGIQPWGLGSYFWHHGRSWLQVTMMINFHEKMVREHTNVIYLYRKIMSVHIEEMESITEPNTIHPNWKKYSEAVDYYFV